MRPEAAVPGRGQPVPPVVRTVVRWFYGIAAFIWLAALGLAVFRLYQMRTLTPLEAQVLKTEVDSYQVSGTGTDSNGFTTDSGSTVYAAVALVRYRFGDREYVAEARHGTGSFRALQERIARRWRRAGRIRVHIDPARPDKPVPELGLNLHTFQMSLTLALAGLFVAALGYGFRLLAAVAVAAFDEAVGKRGS